MCLSDNSNLIFLVSFDKLVPFLREKATVSRTKACLERFHRLSNLVHKTTMSSSENPERINVRIFVAAFMIVAHPKRVFERIGTLEGKLLESAKKVLDIFEKITRSTMPMHRLHPELTRSLPVALFAYLRDFRAWKAPDEAKLVVRIKHALVALLMARERLPPDEPEDSQIKTEFRTQIRRLRDKVQQIAGPEALAKFDEEQGVARVDMAVESSAGSGSLREQAAAVISDRMTNEQLAHELLLDPTFQLSDRGTESDSAARVRKSFHQAFWDTLALDIGKSIYVRVINVLIEVRNGIVDVASAAVATSCAEVLDLELIQQQIDAGMCNWDSCAGLIASVVALIRRAQSPRRDTETAERWAALQEEMSVATDDLRPVVLCHGLEFLLDRVNALRIDAANTRLRFLAPVLRDHGVDYERGKFQGKLDAGTLTLERTQAWLRAHTGTSHNDIFVNAFLDLVVCNEPLRKEASPETLLMDVTRICAFQEEFVHVARSAALVARIVSVVGADSAKQIAAALESNRDMLQAVEIVVAVARPVAIAIEQCANPTDPVYLLMRTRIRAAIKSGVPAGLPDAIAPMALKLAVKVNRVISINRAVHGPTYDRILE
jgi:hypothetical protein